MKQNVLRLQFVFGFESVFELTLSLHSDWLSIAHLDAALVVVTLLRIRSCCIARSSIVQHHHLVLTSLLNEELLALGLANCALNGSLNLIRVGHCLLLHWNDLVHSLVGLDTGMDGFLVGVLLRIG